MGKKGSWFAAIKRVFVSHSKDKPVNESEEKRDKKKNKGPGRARHVERKSFIPLFREPSSIEKILGEAEREHNIVFRPPTPTPTPPPLEQPKAPSIDPSPLPPPPSLPTPSHPPPPRVASPRPPSPRAPSPGAVSPRAASPRITNYPRETSFRPEPTLRNHHASATKIQAAYRGYMARRSFRALRGLVRLQGVVRGQSVKRQTMSAMKYMQLLVRVQSQIQSRRIQMLENQARQQAQQRADKEVESTLGKWSLASEAGNEDWDDSVLTKEEVDTRLQRKIDAVIKRERAMAYAYSHQLWKSTPKSTQTVSDLRSGGYPWWWNWLEKQLPQQTPIENHQAAKSYRLTPPRPNSEFRPSPRPVLGTNNNGSNSNRHQHNLGFENIESGTPRSTRSSVLVPSSRFARTPPPFGGISVSKYSRPRGGAGDQSPFDAPLKDDDSLVSCPPFSVPNYITPTVSAKAKARPSSNPKERFPGTPGSESSRRSSFPLTQGAGSFKWNKASFFSGNDSSSQRIKGLDKNQSLHSIGNLSVDSTVSLPAGVGRKPFNRFV